MSKHNFWSISLISILFALLLTPLIVSVSLYFPYVTGKVFAFRLGTTVALAAWLVLVLKRPEYLPKKSGILAASGIFLIWLAICNIFGIDRQSSFFSNFERMEGWFTHLYLFIYLVVLSSVIKTDKMWNWMLGSSVVVANIIALIAAFDQEQRTNVVLGNSTYVAIYVLFNLFFVFLLAYRMSRTRASDAAVRFAAYAYYAVTALLFVYVIFRTQTRGTILALVFSAGFFAVLTTISHWKHKRVRVVSLSLLTLVLAASALFWINRDSQFIQNNPMLARVTTISASEGTGRARLVNWSIAWEAIKDRPLLGWGQENFIYAFPMHFNPQMYNQEAWFDRTHNALLDWGVQGGVLATLLYLSLFAVAAHAVHRSTSLTRTEKNILHTLFVAYLIHNMFVFDNYSSYLMFFLTLGLVMHHQHKGTLMVSEKTRQIGLAVGLIGAVWIGYVVILQPYTVARGLIATVSSQDAQAALAGYERLSQKDTFGNFEVFTRMATDAGAFLRVPDQALVERYITLVQQEGQQMLAESPRSLRVHEFFGSFLYQTGNVDAAVELLERARAIAPNRQSNLYILGYAYVEQGELDKAVEVFKHAYDVLPENEKARQHYGAALLLKGDQAGRALIEGYSYKDSFFLTVFNRTKQYKEVISILEQMIADQPTNYQLQVSLAVAHLESGNREKAIEIIRGVMKAVPAFEPQGAQIIKDIQSGKAFVR